MDSLLWEGASKHGCTNLLSDKGGAALTRVDCNAFECILPFFLFDLLVYVVVLGRCLYIEGREETRAGLSLE